MNENGTDINNSANKLTAFINNYGLDFLTEDQLRFCFIKGLKLKAKQGGAEIEKPYLSKNNKNGGILKRSDLLLKNSRARLDLFYKSEGIENYLEFKFHPTKATGDDPNTKFGDVMNDLHRLSHLASSKEHTSQCENKEYYFVYAFNENMKVFLEKWKDLSFITELFIGKKTKFNANDYVKNNKFWDTNKLVYGCGEFRKRSFASFDCKDNQNKNTKPDSWLPKQGTSFLNDIKYTPIFSKKVDSDLYLVVLEISK